MLEVVLALRNQLHETESIFHLLKRGGIEKNRRRFAILGDHDRPVRFIHLTEHFRGI